MSEMDEFAADTCEPMTVHEMAAAHRKMISALSPENGVYRMADVEALVKAISASMAWAGRWSLAKDMQKKILEQHTAAWEAITPEVLARCRREPR